MKKIYGVLYSLILLVYGIMPALAASSVKTAPIEILADDLVVDQKTGTAVFTGHVKAVQDDYTLLSHKMIVYYLSKLTEGVEKNSISKIEAFGDVELFNALEKAKGDEGVYDLQTNTVQLIGEVQLSKDNNVVHGSKLVYNLETGKSKLSGTTQGGDGNTNGRVKGIFVPE